MDEDEFAKDLKRHDLELTADQCGGKVVYWVQTISDRSVGISSRILSPVFLDPTGAVAWWELMKQTLKE